MRYIVNNKEVSRDTFYFCQSAKLENKTFMFLNPDKDVQTNINRHPEYDYIIIDEIRTYYTKGEKTVKEWFGKGDYYNSSWCPVEEMKKRYNKSKFKDTMTLEEWYTKNGWTLKSETKYEIKRYDIPAQEDFEEKEVKTKLFSVTVKNDDTVKTINEIEEKYGDCIECVLRDFCNTEIIYKDWCKEI